ncbi:MAG: Arylsulfatase [Planctomycetaceae bacterium]|nr:Arylsulfatase [Planctomycetaceae bacterium]
MKAIVISFDRWHAGFLGLYGNPWVDTPALDGFAAESAVFDQHFAENLSPNVVQHAWWTGRYQCPLDVAQQQREPTWLQWLGDHGITSCLLHDPAARLPVDVRQFSTSRAISLEDVGQLHFEEDAPKFVKAAVQRIQQMGRKPELPELFWIHAAGLPIDEHSAAYEELYADDAPQTKVTVDKRADRTDQTEPTDDTTDFDPDFDDPDDDDLETDELVSTPKDTDDELIVFPPRFWRRARSSPRELADASLRGAGWDAPVTISTKTVTPSEDRSAPVNWQLRRDLYSGQVTQWDAWVGKMIEAALRLAESTPVMIIFTAAAGQHLGEHAESSVTSMLFEETIHVPLIIHVPQTDPFVGRRLALSTAADIPATILDWFQVVAPATVKLDGTSLLPHIRDDQPLEHEIVFVGSDLNGAARTKDFYFHQDLDQRLDGESIFVKPDDRWDADNMLRQLPDAAESLKAQWQAFVERIRERARLVESDVTVRDHE